ncbi:unnamed protein product [Microthlaspi erraticum]|uniref:Serine/threonine-protein phosphatase n=1 Tax=Microthlaspi erraticum TaxID=1685480 RepID=A0A6D2J8G1_9BRAS|nr:unnamed protein product [Microthlaspi erraticum]
MASANWWQYEAPNFVTLEIFFETHDDFPGPRCGHTLTALNGCLILFGGTTAAESDGTSMPELRLQSVTNSVHRFDVFSQTWTRVFPDGEPPSPRALHAAASNGTTMLAIQGGLGRDGPCSGELYILEMNFNNEFRWQRLDVQGLNPGPRFGHAMSFAYHRVIIFGGKREHMLLGDTWAFDTTWRPAVWERLYPYGSGPIPRMYSSASTRDDNIFMLCGGRDCNGSPLGDAFGLEFRRDDGRWVWIPVAGVDATCRFQHSAVFVGPRLHVVGGVLSPTRLIDAEAAAVVLNTTNGEWLGGYPQYLVQRYGHASASYAGLVYVHGGLREGEFLCDLLVSDDGIIPQLVPSQGPQPAIQPFVLRRMSRSLSESTMDRLANLHIGVAQVQQPIGVNSNERNVNRGGLVRQLSLDRFEDPRGRLMRYSSLPPVTIKVVIKDLVQKVISTLLKPQSWEPPASREFFLSYDEVAELCSAAKKIIIQEPTVLQLNAPIKVFGDLHGQFGDLMRLFHEYGSPSTDISYIDYLFLGDYVDRGKHSLETVVLLLALKASYLSIFWFYVMTYIFIVQSSKMHVSLVQVEYPKSIHLIRGNHESCEVNLNYGFQAECLERILDRKGSGAFSLVNDLFNHLPLAALIQKKIFCVHGGIGSSVQSVEQIDKIQRPVYMGCQYESARVVKDLLWSDPTENDGFLGVRGNARGPTIVSFGPDVVKAFCERNKLDMIIRAHECVMDGFERFAGGKLITVFSATNYCGAVQNAGAILVIGRDLLVVPKLIHPLPPPISPEDTPDKAWLELDSERPPSPARGHPKPIFEIGSTSS